MLVSAEKPPFVVRNSPLKSRARALASTALNFCSTAENAFVLGEIRRGHKAIEKARHTADRVRVHLDQPNHISADSVPGIRDQLASLEKRISNLEARLQS